ncbi:MAG: copper ion binding protein [Actinomycetota bacterium]
MKEEALFVPEVTCGHCVSAIEGGVWALAGVDEVRVDLEAKNVTVTFDESKVSIEDIVKAIEAEGYRVTAAR